jgi:hypothetical protein
MTFLLAVLIFGMIGRGQGTKSAADPSVPEAPTYGE